MSQEVPVWLYLLSLVLTPAAALAAVGLTNSHSRKVAQDQRVADQQTWLRDRRHQAFDDALKALGHAQIRIGAQAPVGVEALADAIGALTRAQIYASEPLREKMIHLMAHMTVVATFETPGLPPLGGTREEAYGVFLSSLMDTTTSMGADL